MEEIQQPPNQNKPQQSLPNIYNFSVIEDSLSNDSSPDALSKSLAKQENELKFKDGARGESVRTHVHCIMILGMYVISICLFSMILIRTWDFLSPCYLKWLSETQDHDIERVLFSGIILSMATKYFTKYKVFDKV
jgi:hypothetical protein